MADKDKNSDSTRRRMAEPDPNGEENPMNGTVTKLCDIDSIAIPEPMLEMHVDEQRVEEELQQLSLRYAKESATQSVAAGDIVYARADKDSYPDGRTILLYTGMAVPGAEAASKAALGLAVGAAFTAALADKTVTLTIEKIVHRTPVEVNDALIASIGIDGVTTVDGYRTYLREKAMADLQMERSKEIIRYLMDQMAAGSTFVYDEAAMDAYIQSNMEDFAAECDEEDMDVSPEEIRESVIAQAKQGWMAEAFCQSRGIVLDEAMIEQQADQMQEMMSLMGEKVPERAELLDMVRQGEAMNHLFEYIDTIVEQKLGGSNGNC